MVYSATLLVLFLVPIGLGLSWYAFGWPDFPMHGELTPEDYAERITLLKYMISLGLSMIGATWFLATRISPRKHADYRLLSWAWTLIGIAILSGFLEIYLTYKDFFSLSVNLEDAAVSAFARVRYYVVLRGLFMSYFVADTYFFSGGMVLMFAVIKALHAAMSPKPAN